MQVLLILNDPPYGTERSYNGLRLALALARESTIRIRVFLMADAVACAKLGQTTPEGYYNLGRMLKGLTAKGVEIGACGSCMDARGFTDTDLAEGVCRSSMAQLASWTLEADKVISF
ncbi:MAG: DsrE/DsrF/TusD sulfur relay family protein [Candidatus Limnocylindrales bacterium]